MFNRLKIFKASDIGNGSIALLIVIFTFILIRIGVYISYNMVMYTLLIVDKTLDIISNTKT